MGVLHVYSRFLINRSDYCNIYLSAVNFNVLRLSPSPIIPDSQLVKMKWSLNFKSIIIDNDWKCFLNPLLQWYVHRYGSEVFTRSRHCYLGQKFGWRIGKCVHSWHVEEERRTVRPKRGCNVLFSNNTKEGTFVAILIWKPDVLTIHFMSRTSSLYTKMF